MQAYICIQSWAGRVQHKCRIVGETPKRYRIEVDTPTALPPGFSLLMPGQTRDLRKKRNSSGQVE